MGNAEYMGNFKKNIKRWVVHGAVEIKLNALFLLLIFLSILATLVPLLSTALWAPMPKQPTISKESMALTGSVPTGLSLNHLLKSRPQWRLLDVEATTLLCAMIKLTVTTLWPLQLS